MKFLTSVISCFVIHAMLVRCAPFHETLDVDPDLNDSIDLCAAEVGLLVGNMELDGKIVKEEMISSLHPTLKQMPNITPIHEDDFYHCVDEANDYEGGCIVVSEYFKSDGHYKNNYITKLDNLRIKNLSKTNAEGKIKWCLWRVVSIDTLNGDRQIPGFRSHSTRGFSFSPSSPKLEE
ncbi:hypothetical protein TSAR_000299 [Trichomalopsis sarcophagae]|uniref:Uncharacterized protein n=1 Tax=Trichomalopsis sarcophagae TaxID=543379 RepID=A0A232EPG6_9HYME|nr:hypothetical protein TSAR_000299 [Trichomalopsis sarcophagae]